MKTIVKIMAGIVLSALMITSLNAQPKSEIPEENESRMNWADADTLFTFNFDEASGKWVYFQREIRKFNGHDLPIENFVQEWDVNSGQWQNYLRVNYTYDQNDNEIEVITQQWDPGFNNWVNAELKTTTYKGRKKQEILFQQWKMPTNEWYNIMKYLLKYNDNGKENVITISLYNGITQSWDNHRRFIMEFAGDFSPPSTVISENWKKDNWETIGRYEITYTLRGKKKTETRYTWNQSNRRWLEGILLEMNYDKKGNQIEYLESKYDFANKTWIQFNKNTAEYNESGNMTTKTEYIFNRQTSQWEVKNQFKFSTEATM